MRCDESPVRLRLCDHRPVAAAAMQGGGGGGGGTWFELLDEGEWEGGLLVCHVLVT